MMSIRTILFGTDFSPHSDYAYSLAAGLARNFKARLLLAHVREMPVTAIGEFGMLPPEAEDVEEARQRLVSRYPADAMIDLKYLLAEGPAASELLRLADENSVDLIVVGSHGHSGLARLLMG